LLAEFIEAAPERAFVLFRHLKTEMWGKIVSEIKEDKSLTVVSEIDTLQLVKNKELQCEKAARKSYNRAYFV